MACTLRYSFSFVFICLLTLVWLSAQQTDLEFLNYLTDRHELMQQDSQLYFDHDMALSSQEVLLNEQLQSVQTQMLSEYKEQHFFPPARNFYQSKKHIEASVLFQFIKQMPKGGILHLHAGAIGDADWIIEKARSLPEMYIYWDDKSNQNIIKGSLCAFRKSDIPEGYRQVSQLLSEDPTAYDEIRSLLVFEEEMDMDSVDIWQEFQSVFGRINDFVHYQPVYEDYIVHGLQIFIDDNIQHVELRGPFLDIAYDLDHPRGTMGIETFANSLENIRKRIQNIDPGFSLKFIHCSLRFNDRPTIWNEMQTVYKHRLLYPEMLKGFDLVAEEDAGHSTLFHAYEFLRLDSLEKSHGVTLPLYLHDGESNWASVSNLYDAVLLDTKRIGHGYNLFRFPSLVDRVRQKDICMEVNPLSNQILGYIRDLRNHPASTYLRRGINCTINSDDPLIFDYHGLSYDFWSVFLAWELDLAALKKLTQNSIVYSVLSAEEKQKALSIWNERWNEFVDSMLESDILHLD